MNIAIINKQMDFDETEISSFLFYAHIVFLLLIFHAIHKTISLTFLPIPLYVMTSAIKPLGYMHFS